MAERGNYHHGALRQALIDGAKEILAETGHEQFSLNEVARRAGVSTAAPYRHFSNREALLSAVAEEGYATLAEKLESTSGLARLGGVYVRFAHDNPGLFVTMFRSRPGGTESAAGRAAFETLLRAVAAAQRSGEIATYAPPEITARSVWATLHGLAVLNLQQPHDRYGLGGEPEELATTTLSALLGLKNE
jgi:AcrR family transcriptional regulator